MSEFIQSNSKKLFYLGLVAGYTYILLLPFHPYALSYLLKAVPVLTLGLLAFSGVGGLSAKQKALFVCAMLGAAGGDIFLDLDRTLNLKPALACFLVTQVAYIALFVPLRDTTSWRRWLMMPIGLMALGLVYLFSKTAGPLFIPVLVYVIVLCGMAFSALLVANNHWVNIGGILFLIADALIGINRFILPFDYSTNIIVSIYITSQLCIGWGLLFYKNAVKTRQESSSL